ncbi:Serine/threonine-protein kinase fray2 [Dichanthelium oligosanthes]|uniref:Serine/threonine-protein kinase fray2 n=1 Tax=Dichanthelium oligosanthes TaxID=888268 RepID=A0A1E5W039_9POAL|nr:Serine/threonine-protein kinase fray2 [Dichanthelium oligosanthes]
MTGSSEKAAGGGGAERRKYPIHVEDYELYEEIGQGVSAIVYRAHCKPLDEIVAVKVLDFERTNSDLAGNILVDSRGGIKLGDFGVSACLFDSGDRQRARNTFVGTPCWMAPEVMEQLHGYDFRADIWSFGITALELAHGHAPFSKYPPMKVLLMTLQNAPPGLDYERDKKFSRNFKQMIAMCLVKDPSKRPSAKKLLKQPFFKQARSTDFIARKLVEGLPGLGARYQALKEKDEHLMAQKKMSDGKKEEISQDEYKRGISSWTFDMDDLRSQASLGTECEDIVSGKDLDTSFDDLDSLQEQAPEGPHLSRDFSMKYDPDTKAVIWNVKRDIQTLFQLSHPMKGSFLLVLAHLMDSFRPKREDHDDRSKPPLIRGRFKVIPGHVDFDKTISRLASLSIPSSAEAASSIIGGSFYMQLYSVLQTNMLQREQILNAMKQLYGCDLASPGIPSMASPCIPSTSRSTSPSTALSADRSMLEAAHEKEKELMNEVLELQWRSDAQAAKGAIKDA